MVGGFTTAAVVNYSFSPPKKPVAALRYMPNARQEQEREQTEEELEAESDYNLKVLQEAARQKAEAKAREQA